MQQAEASRISADAAKLMAQRSGDRAVATMRIEWVGNLRNILSEYPSILVTADIPTDEEKRKLSDLGTRIDLLLNLDEDKHKDLWDIADKIYRTEDRLARVAMDNDLVKAGRAVLKAEWEKIKREMRGEDAAAPLPNRPPGAA